MSPPAPPPNPCAAISGTGILRLKPKARFELNARYKSRTQRFEGSITYTDPVAGLTFESTAITSIDNRGDEATIAGTGRANGRPVTFVIVVRDANPDVFAIELSSGYSAQSTLKQGQIKIRNQC